VDDSITRDQLLSLFQEGGGDEVAALVAAVLERLGWGQKVTFVKDDVVTVMEGVTAYARDAMVGPNAPPLEPADREHVGGLLDALDHHAFPLMHEQASKQDA
jgi:hypothetical protein